MKFNLKVILNNFILTTIFFIFAGLIYDFINYGKLIPFSDPEFIFKRGEENKGLFTDEYYCYGLHPYLGFINACSSFESKGFIKEYDLIEDSNLDDAKIFKLLIVGGSVANHLSRNNILEQELLNSFKSSENIKINKFNKIMIINAALGGYKQPQQFYSIAYLLAQGYRFDAIINIAGFNEIALTVSDNYINKIATILPRNHARREDKESFLVSPYLHLSSLFNLHPFTRYIYPRINNLASKAIKSIKYKPYSFDLPRNKKEAFQLAKKIWIESSNMSEVISKSYKIPYFEFLQPNQYVFGSKVFTKKELNEKIISHEKMPYREPIEEFYSQVNQDDFSIPKSRLVDLRYIFIDEKKDVYADACCHFNELGNKIIAKHISKNIIESLKLQN